MAWLERCLRSGWQVAVSLSLAMAMAAGSAAAQPLTIGRFNFNFSNPGARSLGFGGAFAALADDATAAFANPAGLVQLTRLEASIEWRLWDRSPSFISGGRVEGEPTGIGIDTARSIVLGRDRTETTGPSFAAVVYPRGRWCFGLYAHRLARFEIATESQGFFFVDEELPLGAGRFPGSRERADLSVDTAGLSAAWRANDRLSLGLGIAYSDVSLETASEFFLPDSSSVASTFGRISFLPERRLFSSSLSIDDADLTLNAGILWSVTRRLSAGLLYRQGAEATGSDRLEAPPFFPGEPPFRTVLQADFEVPDVWGAGLAYRSKGGSLTVAAEADRVGYGGLLRVLENEDAVVATRDYFDVWEYHLGAEYALLRSRPIVAFRLGGWVEANGDDAVDDRFTHFAAGVGVAGESYQVDVAADLSEEVDTASVSFIYSF